MKKQSSVLRKVIALVLCFAFAMTLVACGNDLDDADSLYSSTGSTKAPETTGGSDATEGNNNQATEGKDDPTQPSYNIGNDDDNEFGDDDDDFVVVNPGGNGGNGNGGGNAADHDDGKVPAVKADEEGQKSFLESVPKELAGSKVEILVWYKVLNWQKAKMERFTEATGIEVEFVYADEENYLNKLVSMQASGNAPEIACVRPGDYPLAIMQGYFRSLTAEEMNSIDGSIYDLSTMNKLAWGGENYGYIAYNSPMVNYGVLTYNQDLFDQYGVKDPYTLWREGNWNWNTFVSTCQEIQKKSGITACTTEYFGYLFTLSAGADSVTMSNGTLTNNSDSTALRDAFRWANNLMMNGAYKILDTSLNSAGFISGNAAMYVNNSWMLQAGERYENLSFTLGYAPIPSPTGMSTTVPASIQQWGYPKGSDCSEAAKYVMEWWMNPTYNSTSEKMWLNDSVASFMAELSKMPLTPTISAGVVNYGGDYNWEMDYNYQLLSAGAANVDSVMDSWKTVIEKKLKDIYNDFG